MTNLEGVVNNISRLENEVSELLENNSDSYTPFIDNIKNDLTNVKSSLHSNEKVSSELSNSISVVTNTLEELTGFVNEINNIGSEIELISLNANIKAAHIGIEGAALSVPAKEIQKLSIDAIKHTGSVIDHLSQVNTLSGELQKLINNDTNNGENSSGSNKIQNELNEIFLSLNTIISGALTLLGKLHKSTSRLKDEIKDIIKRITIHSEVDSRVYKISGMLNELIRKSNPLADKKLFNHTELQELSKTYTMNKQRRIHHMISSDRNGNELMNDDILQTGSDEFGDNVELF